MGTKLERHRDTIVVRFFLRNKQRLSSLSATCPAGDRSLKRPSRVGRSRLWAGNVAHASLVKVKVSLDRFFPRQIPRICLRKCSSCLDNKCRLANTEHVLTKFPATRNVFKLMYVTWHVCRIKRNLQNLANLRILRCLVLTFAVCSIFQDFLSAIDCESSVWL